MNISDHTDSIWFQCFNDTGNTIIGKNANELNSMKVMFAIIYGR